MSKTPYGIFEWNTRGADVVLCLKGQSTEVGVLRKDPSTGMWHWRVGGHKGDSTNSYCVACRDCVAAALEHLGVTP